MKEYLRLKIWRFENELIGFIEDQFYRNKDFNPTNKYESDKFYSSDKFCLRSNCAPIIDNSGNAIYLRGTGTEYDNSYIYYKFKTITEAQAYAENLKNAVAEYNLALNKHFNLLPQPKTQTCNDCERVL